MTRRVVLVVFTALLAAACAGTPMRRQAHLSQAQRDAADRLIIVTVANDADQATPHAGSTPRGYDGIDLYSASARARASIKAVTRQYHLTQVAAWPIEPLKVHCVVFEIPLNASRDDLLAQMRKDSRLLLAQPMQDFHSLSQSYNDPYVSLQRGFARIDVAEAHKWSTGANVRVAIIDTGMDAAHADLAGRIAETRNFVDTDTLQFNRDRHGTEVAGVVAAVANNREGIVGIAPDVRLIALKACWQLASGQDNARCNSLTLAQAIVAAMQLHAQVVNLSLAGPIDPLLAALIEQGNRRGIIFVGAASFDASTPQFPAAVDGVLGVISAEPRMLEPPRAPIASALSAPGIEILTLVPGGHYDFVSGSSLATAHVTGTVALLLAQNPKLTPAAIAGLLRRTSTTIATDRGVEVSIDACAALAGVDRRVSCTAADGATSTRSQSPAIVSVPLNQSSHD